MNANEPQSINPFAAPVADIGVQPEADLSPQEIIRNQFLRHEHNIKSIGSLFLLGSIFSGFMLASFAGQFAFGDMSTIGMSLVIGVMIVAAVFAGQLSAGLGLRRLAPWSRIPGAISSTIMMIGVPIGTILGVVFLYLLFSKKSKYVFSAEYKDIIAATPHVKLKTSRIMIVLLLALIALLAVGIGAAVFGAV